MPSNASYLLRSGGGLRRRPGPRRSTGVTGSCLAFTANALPCVPVPACARLCARFDIILSKQYHAALIYFQRRKLSQVDQVLHGANTAAQDLGGFIDADGRAGWVSGLRLHVSRSACARG